MIESDDKNECGLQSGCLTFLWDSDGQILLSFLHLLPHYFPLVISPDSRESLRHQISNQGSVLKSSLDSILLLKSLQTKTHTDINLDQGSASEFGIEPKK